MTEEIKEWKKSLEIKLEETKRKLETETGKTFDIFFILKKNKRNKNSIRKSIRTNENGTRRRSKSKN